MNSYDLSRAFWNWAFENPEKVKPIHSAIYFFAIEHCNRLGWKDKFGFPSQMVMDAIGVRKWHTYSKAFNDLVEFGFIILIEKSKNQYSSNIISLKSATPKNGKALDKARAKHGTKHGTKQGQYNKTIEPLNIEQYKLDDSVKDIFINWLEYREEIKKPITNNSTLKTLVNKFNSEPPEKVEWVVNQSIENGWQGLFWDKYIPKQPKQTRQLTKLELHMATQSESQYKELIKMGYEDQIKHLEVTWR